MKKVIFSFLVLLSAGGTFANASMISPAAGATQQQQDDKMKIKAEELPEAVKTTLQSADYKGWAISAAYHLKSADQYEVELKKDTETKTVKLDNEGKIVE
jgi:hypothetical protein